MHDGGRRIFAATTWRWLYVVVALATIFACTTDRAAAQSAQAAVQQIQQRQADLTRQRDTNTRDLEARRQALANAQTQLQRAQNDRANAATEKATVDQQADQLAAMGTNKTPAQYAQLQTLRQRQATLTTTIGNLDAAIGRLQAIINTLTTEIARLEAALAALATQIEQLDLQFRSAVRGHMDCIAVSRKLYQFIQAVGPAQPGPTSSIGPNTVVGTGAQRATADVATEFHRVSTRGIETNRDQALMTQVLPQRAQAFMTRIAAAVTTESSSQWGTGVAADGERQEAAAEVAKRQQEFNSAITQAQRTGDCSGLHDSLTSAEAVFWRTRGYIMGPSETLMGQDLNLTPR